MCICNYHNLYMCNLAVPISSKFRREGSTFAHAQLVRQHGNLATITLFAWFMWITMAIVGDYRRQSERSNEPWRSENARRLPATVGSGRTCRSVTLICYWRLSAISVDYRRKLAVVDDSRKLDELNRSEIMCTSRLPYKITGLRWLR